ncbi:MAG: nucleotidyltransferase family protein [Armatimonadota bacterium]|nr:nucleotidyltransferase family protein [Armatimonadota bacterium]MCX7778391.1 nucleotidyltransferase family protein [Armatimonadota bacterium]MDW8026260.1 nucleotidyltransferase family protein [Armatimonadota bacterium]
MIVAIILAAGRSERMDSCKLLLPFGESTILESVVRNAVSSLAESVIVVINPELPRAFLQRLQDIGATVVVNEMQQSQMIDSLRVGLIEARERFGKIEAFIVMLADQPAVEHEIVDMLISAHKQTGAGIIIPTFSGKRGHPVLLSGRYVDKLISYRGEQGLRSFIREHSSDVLELPVQTSAVLRDIDTREDYERELRILMKRHRIHCNSEHD